MTNYNKSRRTFLQKSALASSSVFVPQFLQGLSPKSIADKTGKSLVVIQWSGGNDGLNTLVPFQNDLYYKNRPNLAIQKNKVLKLNDELGFNPIMPEWFTGALKKSVSFDLDIRYSTVTNMLTDLRHPNPEFLKDDPVVEKKSNQLLFWKMISGFWFVTFLLLIYLFGIKT